MHKSLLAAWFVILLFDHQCLAQISGGMPPLRLIESKQTSTRPEDNYGGTVRACIQPGVSFRPLPRVGSENPQVQYQVALMGDGKILDVVLRKSSGNLDFDRAVETGIRHCNPFSRPPTGSYPGYIDINYKMFD